MEVSHNWECGKLKTKFSLDQRTHPWQKKKVRQPNYSPKFSEEPVFKHIQREAESQGDGVKLQGTGSPQNRALEPEI